MKNFDVDFIVREFFIDVYYFSNNFKTFHQLNLTFINAFNVLIIQTQIINRAKTSRWL